jgi:hypothetical protein
MKPVELLIVCLALCCFSCGKKQQVSGEHPVLKVELKEQPVPVSDIFRKVEIIPLETSEESLLGRISKVETLDDRIFVSSQSSVFMFDPEGKYLNKIQRIGRGPQEYVRASDFTLDPSRKTVGILDAIGAILTYDFDGNFVKKSELPKPPPAYAFFEMLDENTYVTWSFTKEDMNGVNIIDAATFEIKQGFFPLTDIQGMFAMGAYFHKFNGETFYHERLGDYVYRIDGDGYEIAYEWDTGVEIIDRSEFTNGSLATNEGRRLLGEKYDSGEIPFAFAAQDQTKRYCYAKMVSKNGVKYLFYNRNNGKSFYFGKTAEGIDLNLIHMGDDYAIGLI